MHEGFADWFREISLDPKEDELKKRWAGVEAFAKGVGTEDVLNLALTFFRPKVSETDFISRFRAAFKAADEAFAMKANDAEIRMLAGSTLVATLDRDNNVGNFAALSVRTGEFFGNRPAPIADIVKVATMHLHRAALAIRAPRPAPVADLTGVIKEVEDAGQQANVQVMTPALVKIVRQLAKGVESLRSTQAMLREESDVLWWLISGRSADLNIALTALTKPAQCLVIGKELADLVHLFPGPVGAPAFLEAALRHCAMRTDEKATVADVVNGCPENWSNSIAFPSPTLEWFCPLFLAAKKKDELPGKGWKAGFQKATGLKAGSSGLVTDFALQAYEEGLLLRTASRIATRKSA